MCVFAPFQQPETYNYNLNMQKGKKIKIKGEKLLAQAISHELDHLDGILFVDKIIPGTLEYVTQDDNKEKKNKK